LLRLNFGFAEGSLFPSEMGVQALPFRSGHCADKPDSVPIPPKQNR